jgi:hypothetical protein
VTNSDDYGNYSLDVGDLHIVFVNVWPSKFHLLSGDPEGSLKYLKNDLEMKAEKKKWLLVTHYMPKVQKSFQESIYVHGKKNKYLQDFDVLLEKYKSSCLGVLYGHNHVKNMVHGVNGGIYHFNLPGPASYLSHNIETRESINKKNIEIPFFVYHKQELHCFLINVVKNSDNILYAIRSIKNG